jgi:exonuclease V gamma subunit
MGMKEIKEMRRAEAEARKAINKARREAEAQLKGVEETIHELEERQRTLTDEIENSESFATGRAHQLNRELSILQDRLLETMETWEKLTAVLAENAPQEASSD